MTRKKARPEASGMETIEKTRRIVAVLDDKQGEDLLALDVSAVCPIAEHLVLVSARGQRHAQGLADAVLALASEHKLLHLGMEGYQAGTWILIDLNDVIVHVFQEDMRRFFNLEGLWSEGKRLDFPAAGAPEQ